jgi:hypothetical protein
MPTLPKPDVATIATPRTDAVSLKVSLDRHHGWIRGYKEMRSHARSIERELAQSKQEIQELAMAARALLVEIGKPDDF